MVTPQEEMVERIVTWCSARADVRAVVLTGSLAQPAARVDDMSDVDIEITFADVTPELLGGTWWRDFGEVWTAYTLAPLPVWSVVYAGGTTVDMSVVDAGRIGDMVASGVLSPGWDCGYRVLLDRDGLTRGLPAPRGEWPDRGRLTAAEFRRLVDGFWFDGLRVPKYIARGQLWKAKSRDWVAKAHLLRMLEWHATIIGGHRVEDTGLGSDMPSWLAPELWVAVHDVFGRFDAADARRAFTSSLDLFWRVAGEVAAASGFEFPLPADRHLRERVEELLRRVTVVWS
ncbi:aminoglycoside 6-adenylyltransferase [Pseudonocardia sp. TRM90224]|uniref:aminoglycoside 6-adenylyltransferase n=1 Tax=Pseudonocardia sp. TRM90224 TaxID=2812678 RepID=UPI001E2BD1C1|nr:aminoglycoside 6-adenylyltransferase [Pseudonocardia sp. TRM90224]